MASPSETPCNNENYSTQKDEHTQSHTGPPNPFSVTFKTEYNFFLCWHLHLAQNFNATALDVLHGRLSEAYHRYNNSKHNDEPPSDIDDCNSNDIDDCNSNNTDADINGIMNIYNNTLIDSSQKSAAGAEQGNQIRQLHGVIDAFVQLKETTDIIARHMAWLAELKLESLLLFPQLYSKKPSSSLMSLMALCSKTRLFIRCVLENMKVRECHYRPQNPNCGHVDEKFVQIYVPHSLKLEHAKKPQVLKPCFRNVSLNLSSEDVVQV